MTELTEEQKDKISASKWIGGDMQVAVFLTEENLQIAEIPYSVRGDFEVISPKMYFMYKGALQSKSERTRDGWLRFFGGSPLNLKIYKGIEMYDDEFIVEVLKVQPSAFSLLTKEQQKNKAFGKAYLEGLYNRAQYYLDHAEEYGYTEEDHKKDIEFIEEKTLEYFKEHSRAPKLRAKIFAKTHEKQ